MICLGIIRKVDNLGRIVIPKELRKTMEIDKNTKLEIFRDNDTIMLRKYDPSCTFCGTIKTENILFKNKLVCPDCMKELNQEPKRS